MHMGELVLYHEKEDISCLFNSYQQPIIPDPQEEPVDSEPPAEGDEPEQSLLNMSQ